MTDLRAIERRARLGYELGRARYALRVLLLLAPLAFLAFLCGRSPERCLCPVLLVAVVAVVLRWQHDRWNRAISAGLVSGAVPMFTGMLVVSFDASFNRSSVSPVCATACLISAVVGGICFGLVTPRRLSDVLAAFPVASGIAVLGSAALGLSMMATVAALLGIVGGVVGLLRPATAA